MWGREEFLSHLKDGEMFPDYFYNVLQESGLSEIEIIDLVYDLGEIREYASKYSDSLSEQDFISLYLNIAEKIIKMYEFKTKQKWNDSIEMEILIGSLLYSNNAYFNIENAINGTYEIRNMNPEIEKFIEEQTFSNKYFEFLKVKRSSIKYDSAMAPNSLLSEHRTEEGRTFTFEYKNGKRIKSENYSDDELSSKQKLKYGITTERDYQLIKNNTNFYIRLWSIISTSSFLNEQEKEIYKKNILNYYEKFEYEMGLFSNDFTPYFSKVYKKITSKEDFDKIMENKDYLYQFDNPVEYEFLLNNGINNNLITYFIQLPSWQLYRSSISQLSFLNEEEKKMLYQNYPTYFDNRLQFFYINNDTSFINKELSSCNSLEELWSLIHTKRVQIYNETKEKEFNRLVLVLNS